MYENQEQSVCGTNQPIEAGELSKLNFSLNEEARQFGSLLYNLYKVVEVIKSFPPQDQKTKEHSEITGLVDEFHMTSDLLKQNNKFLEHIIKHLSSLV